MRAFRRATRKDLFSGRTARSAYFLGWADPLSRRCPPTRRGTGRRDTGGRRIVVIRRGFLVEPRGIEPLTS